MPGGEDKKAKKGKTLEKCGIIYMSMPTKACISLASIAGIPTSFAATTNCVNYDPDTMTCPITNKSIALLPPGDGLTAAAAGKKGKDKAKGSKKKKGKRLLSTKKKGGSGSKAKGPTYVACKNCKS